MKLSRILSKIREESGINQKQLAQKMNVSASRVSRMETDSAQLQEEEIRSYMQAIGTPQAKEFISYLKQHWDRIRKPDFFHPSLKHLRLAEQVLKKISSLKKEIDQSSILFKELDIHDQTLIQESEFLQSTYHTIACIGSIGVGKTTAICGFTGLKLDNKPVLHAAGGRSTVCEVQIQQGPEYGITIEPLTEDELYKYIYDFCDYLLSITTEKDDSERAIDAENFSLSTEIERCIRNMADLTIKTKKVGEKREREDLAINLVRELRESRGLNGEKLADELKMEVLWRLNIDNRKKTEIWYLKDMEESSLSWLKKNYLDINHGRNPEFAIPKKININIPEPVLSCKKLNLTIVDTKGVFDTAKREDLETHLSDPRSLTIFCSRFLNAPDETTKTLIQRAIDSGIKERLINETAIMVLPRSDEAVSVNTFDGTPIEDIVEGYLIREDDIRNDLMKYNLREIPVYFYDERKDNPDNVKKFILARMEALRKSHEKRIEDVARTVDKVSENIEDAHAKVAYVDVLKTLTAWINNHKEIKPIGKIHTSLTDAILDRNLYASSVRASVNRYGSWYNLDYYYQIGFGTRRETVTTISKMLDDLFSNIDTMLGRTDLEPAHEFLQELKLYSKSEAEKLYKEIQSLGKEIFKEKLQKREELWKALQARWGQGPGYKIDISKNTENWFDEDEQKRVHELIQNRIANCWADMLSKIAELANGIFE